MTRGFTLIELLVAMTILVLAASMLAEGLRLGLAASQSVGVRGRDSERIHLVQAFLRKELEQMRVAVRGQDSASAACAGDAKELTFVAPFAARGDDGLYRFHLQLDDERDRAALVMRYIPADIGPVAGIEEQVVLVDDVSALRFDYWDGRMWQSAWHERDRLPSRVRVRLDREAGSQRWPELVVAPKVTAQTVEPDRAGG